MTSLFGVPVDAAYHLVSGFTRFLTPALGGLAAVAAIIAFTIAVRLVLMPLSLRAFRGQAAMARLGAAAAGPAPALRQAAGTAADARWPPCTSGRAPSIFAGFGPLLLQRAGAVGRVPAVPFGAGRR